MHKNGQNNISNSSLGEKNRCENNFMRLYRQNNTLKSSLHTFQTNSGVRLFLLSELYSVITKYQLRNPDTHINLNILHMDIYTFTYSLTHSLTQSLTHSLTHSFTHSLTHSLARSFTHSLTHSYILT